MPQSLVKNYLHITFSTKHRVTIIKKSIQKDLFAYLAKICNELECYAIEVGGVEDHVHILCSLSKKITLIKLLEEMKRSSSKWIKTQGVDFKNFYWQIGYGAFSVNPKEIEIVQKYILNQEEHHRNKSFQDEYRSFLQQYDVEFDERYVWD